MLVETRSSLWVGVSAFALLAVRLLARLPAGALIDRVDPKTALSLCEAVRCVLFLVLALVLIVGHFSLALVFGVALLDGAGSALALPAERILVKVMAPDEARSKAVAWTEARQHMVTLLAPPMGGLLFQIATRLPFAVDGLSFGPAALLVGSLTIRERERTETAGSRRTAFRSGFRHLTGHPVLRSGALMAVGMNLLTQALAVALVIRTAAGGATAFSIGVMFALGSVGGIVGAAWAGSVFGRIRWTTTLLIVGAAWVGGLAAAAQTDSPVLLGSVFAVMAFPVPLINTQLISALYTGVPDDRLGITSSSLGLVTGTISPLGPLLAGIVSSRYGTQALLLASIVVTLVLLAGATFALGRGWRVSTGT